VYLLPTKKAEKASGKQVRQQGNPKQWFFVKRKAGLFKRPAHLLGAKMQ
jgi:hypothetical protein